MSYYPIKCIQCLRPIREAERCVKLTKDEIRSDNFEGIRQSDDIQLNDRKSGANKFVLKEKHIEIQYKSLAQLRSESVITNEEVYPVTISPEYAVSDECRNTELVQAVEHSAVAADAPAELRLAAEQITLTDAAGGAAVEVLYRMVRAAEKSV